MKKTINKKLKQPTLNASGNYFWDAGSLGIMGEYEKIKTPIVGIKTQAAPDINKITQLGADKLKAAGSVIPQTTQTPGLGAYLGAAQGVMQLGSQAINNLDTSGIGKEVVGVNDMSRSDILNTSVNVDSNQTNVGGASLSGALSGASAGMCVCAGTLLYLHDGSHIPVEQLTYGDSVIGWKDNKSLVQRIEHFHTPTEKECYEIITEKGFSIRCSNDHPILWSKSGFVKRIPGFRSVGTRQKNFIFKSAQDINITDQIAIIREVPFFGELNLPEARLIGMLIGDGYYGKSKSVTFATADCELKNYVCNYNIKEESNSTDQFFRCRIFDVIKLLKDIGIRGQSKEFKRIPDIASKLNKESLCELLGGLFDTDGCVSIDGSRIRIQLAQSNEPLLKQVQSLLIKIGVISNVSKTGGNKLKVFPNGEEYKRRDAYVLDISDKLSVVNFAKNIKLLVVRKQLKLNSAFKYNVLGKYNNDYGVLFDRVKYINNIGHQLVYNIAVSDSHTYIANNIVTHNSFGPLGAAIGGGVGLLSGGISSIIGNQNKQKAADLAEQQWTNNLQAKNRQFQQQDMRNSMANFAAYGGQFEQSQMKGGLVEFDEGGVHESNVNGGILQGTGVNGKPNLVEEGETKHEDYIFSDRLKINKQIAKLNNLPNNTIGKTFADASKILNKEAKERPNDPISMNAVKADLSKLTQAQEMIKAKKQAKEQPQKNPQVNMLAQGYDNGGDLFMHDNVFSHGGDQTHHRNPMMTSAANVYDGESTANNYLNFVTKGNYIPQNDVVKNNFMYPKNVMYTSIFSGQKTAEKPNPIAVQQDYRGAEFLDKLSNIKLQDNLRYAPVAANMITGISDMFDRPERVQFGRINPEQVTARMDYQPIDTEWMANKMKGQSAGMRDSVLNTSGGNRTIAMAGLNGINRQSQEALGQQYLQAQDINYGRKNQALQFNAGIEAQNVAARNAAQAQNVQLAMQEADLNARNRAARRNAARQAILQAAQDLGGIGRENWAAKTGEAIYGYKTDAQGNITYKK